MSRTAKIVFAFLLAMLSSQTQCYACWNDDYDDWYGMDTNGDGEYDLIIGKDDDGNTTMVYQDDNGDYVFVVFTDSDDNCTQLYFTIRMWRI